MANKHLPVPEELIHRYTLNTCSEEERAMVESWHIQDLSKSTYLPSRKDISLVNIRMANRLNIYIQTGNKKQKIFRLWQPIVIAASLLFGISILTFLYIEKISFSPFIIQKSVTATLPDILPGGYKAILTLHNGRKIQLDDKEKREIILEKNVNISRESGGKIIYQNFANAQRTQLTNTLETPRGGQYQLVLPDGTKVWLNASSTFTYPTIFTGKERLVKLTGEAFFEVSKDPHRPFKVQSNDQTVEVLGTHFNISAYPEEHNTRTTLVEGKVRIYNRSASRIIKPGQEALIKANNHGILIAEADIEKSMAWKNNEFAFNGEDLKSIMRSIARWYDVDILYQGYSDTTRYWGTVSRSKDISAVLKMLESTGKIKFKIEGRRIIAMN